MAVTALASHTRPNVRVAFWCRGGHGKYHRDCFLAYGNANQTNRREQQ